MKRPTFAMGGVPVFSVVVGDRVRALTNMGSDDCCLKIGDERTVEKVHSNKSYGREFYVDSCRSGHYPCPRRWVPIATDFEVIEPDPVTPEELKNARTLPSVDEVLRFFERKP